METKPYEPPEGLPKTRDEFFEKLRIYNTESVQKVHTLRDGMFSSFDSWCDDDGAFNPALLAKDIVDNNSVKTDSISDTLYFYDEEHGFYDRNGDAKVRALIEACLQQENRQHRTTEVTYLVHSKTLTTTTPSHKIALINGLLDPKTQTLEDHTSNTFVTVKMTVRHDPKADCPNIKKFLGEILEPDQIPIAQEMFGYCLLREYPIHKSMVLLGEGANGKSTFLNLLSTFLGSENCSHATLQQLCEGKFELAQLYGKLANICDDLPSEGLKSVGNFKNLTGNAPIMAQYKHKTPFDFLNTAKMLWACNKLPQASEDTIAYYRRFVILLMNKYFLDEKADIRLLDKLTTPSELSGLLNYALEGLKRLLAQGRFSSSTTIEQTRQQYIRTADSCLAFIEETTIIDTDPDVALSDEIIYSNYVNFCRNNKLPIQKKAQLTITMQKTRPEAKHTVVRLDGKLTHAWKFLKLVTTVTTVTTTSPILNFNYQIHKEIETLVTAVTPVTNSSQEASVCQ